VRHPPPPPELRHLLPEPPQLRQLTLRPSKLFSKFSNNSEINDLLIPVKLLHIRRRVAVSFVCESGSFKVLSIHQTSGPETFGSLKYEGSVERSRV
jgi:hypothetical protein